MTLILKSSFFKQIHLFTNNASCLIYLFDKPSTAYYLFRTRDREQTKMKQNEGQTGTEGNRDGLEKDGRCKKRAQPARFSGRREGRGRGRGRERGGGQKRTKARARAGLGRLRLGHCAGRLAWPWALNLAGLDRGRGRGQLSRWKGRKHG